jgi:hypothetical protein
MGQVQIILLHTILGWQFWWAVPEPELASVMPVVAELLVMPVVAQAVVLER